MNNHLILDPIKLFSEMENKGFDTLNLLYIFNKLFIQDVPCASDVKVIKNKSDALNFFLEYWKILDYTKISFIKKFNIKNFNIDFCCVAHNCEETTFLFEKKIAEIDFCLDYEIYLKKFLFFNSFSSPKDVFMDLLVSIKESPFMNYKVFFSLLGYFSENKDLLYPEFSNNVFIVDFTELDFPELKIANVWVKYYKATMENDESISCIIFFDNSQMNDPNIQYIEKEDRFFIV